MSNEEEINEKVTSLFGDRVRAPKDPEQEIILSFNVKYASITIGGGHWILKEEYDDVDFMTRKAFIEKHENMKYQRSATSANGNVTLRDVFWTKLWLESTKRRTYNGIAFDTSNQVGPKIYNTWKGFVIKGKKGDCSLITEYFRTVICNNNEAKYKKFTQYWAHMRQKPWEKPEYAIVLVGDKGVGKSFFLDILQTLIDGRRTPQRRSRHCYRTSNPEDIYGRFRDHLQNRIALALEEVTWGGDKRHEGTLKDYITGKTIKAEKKNGPILDLDNVMRIVMTANDGWIFPATIGERRFEAYYVNNSHQQDHEYFAAIQKQLDNDGYEALMWEWENTDISDFNCREALRTDALMDQIQKNFTKEEEWWDDTLMSGQIQHEDEYSVDGTVSMMTNLLYINYQNYVKQRGARGHILSKTQFGMRLHEFLPMVVDGKVMRNDDGRRVRSILEKKEHGSERWQYYVLPQLRTCRELWDIRLNRKVEWPEPTEWKQQPF